MKLFKTYKISVEPVASRITVGKNPRSLVRAKLEGRNVPPVLNEEGGEASSTVGGWAVFDADASVAVGVSHVCIGVLGVHVIAVPAGGVGDFGRKTVFAGAEALGKAVGEDGVGGAIGLVATPADTSGVFAISTPVGATGDHVET